MTSFMNGPNCILLHKFPQFFSHFYYKKSAISKNILVNLDVEEVDLEEQMRGAPKGACKKGCTKMFGKKVGARLMKECMELCKGGKSGEAICMYYWVHGKNNKKEAEACKKRVSKARMDEVEDLDVEDLEDEGNVTRLSTIVEILKILTQKF